MMHTGTDVCEHLQSFRAVNDGAQKLSALQRAIRTFSVQPSRASVPSRSGTPSSRINAIANCYVIPSTCNDVLDLLEPCAVVLDYACTSTHWMAVRVTASPQPRKCLRAAS